MTITNYLWINTIPNSSLGFWVLNDSEYDVIPPTIDATIHIRGRPGQYRFASDMDSRSFTFSCQFDVYNSAALLVAAIRELTKLLINTDGSPKLVTLKLWNDPDITYQVQYTGAIPVVREVMELSGSFTLSFVAHDPLGTGIAHSIDTTITNNYQIAASIDSDDVGNVESRPVFTIVNTGSETIDSIRITVLQNEV